MIPPILDDACRKSGGFPPILDEACDISKMQNSLFAHRWIIHKRISAEAVTVQSRKDQTRVQKRKTRLHVQGGKGVPNHPCALVSIEGGKSG